MRATEKLYSTRTTLERTLRVSYPAGAGRLTLRPPATSLKPG